MTAIEAGSPSGVADYSSTGSGVAFWPADVAAGADLQLEPWAFTSAEARHSR